MGQLPSSKRVCWFGGRRDVYGPGDHGWLEICFGFGDGWMDLRTGWLGRFPGEGRLHDLSLRRLASSFSLDKHRVRITLGHFAMSRLKSSVVCVEKVGIKCVARMQPQVSRRPSNV